MIRADQVARFTGRGYLSQKIMDVGWVMGVPEVDKIAPSITMATIRTYFQQHHVTGSHIVVVESYSRAEERGYAQCIELSHVCEFGYLMKNNTAYLRMLVPPSMKSQKYQTLVELSLSEDKCVVESITTAICACRAGLGTRCHHVAILLFVLRNLPNLEKLQQRAVPSTSQLCSWNNPKAGPSINILLDISNMGAVRHMIGKEFNILKRAFQDRSGGRSVLSPFPVDFVFGDPFTNVTIQTKMRELFSELRTGLEGRESALEVAYGHKY